MGRYSYESKTAREIRTTGSNMLTTGGSVRASCLIPLFKQVEEGYYGVAEDYKCD